MARGSRRQRNLPISRLGSPKRTTESRRPAQKTQLPAAERSRSTIIVNPANSACDSLLKAEVEAGRTSTKGHESQGMKDVQVDTSSQHPTPPHFQFDGCDDVSELEDEGYESPEAISPRDCWHRALRMWKEFIESREGGVAERCLERDRPFPTVSVMKRFLLYLAQRPNRLGRVPTIHTLRTYLSHFCSAFHKATDTMIDPDAKRVLSKDVVLHTFWDENGHQGLIMELTQRFTKANPDVDTNWFRVTMLSRERLFRDPIAYFLTLAFADDAIKGVKTMEQFWAIKPPKGQKSFQFEWNADKMDMPVFRVTTATGPTPASWTCSSMFRYLSIVTKEAGYPPGSVTIHTMRRGVANKVDDFVSPAQRNQLLGWSSSDIYERDYISRISSVDGQSAFLNETPHTCHIDLLRSAGRNQNPRIPQ
ncbi:MAG: hypothetical protein Q9203_004848 [Teloschistes exilis]